MRERSAYATARYTVRLILGIDEAGRGPVIGPLVLAGVLIDEARLDRLAQLGVKDSKQLSRSRRDAFVPEVMAITRKTRLLTIPARKLDGNLTQVELKGMAQIIRRLRPTAVYLDAPVPPRGIAHYVRALRSLVGEGALEIIAENKADEKYAIVSAASIIAKVHRDRAIEQLRLEYGDFGWGYPSERKTQQFLEHWYTEHGAFPECVRYRWNTVQRLIQNRKTQAFFPLDES